MTPLCGSSFQAIHSAEVEVSTLEPAAWVLSPALWAPGKHCLVLTLVTDSRRQAVLSSFLSQEPEAHQAEVSHPKLHSSF